MYLTNTVSYNYYTLHIYLPYKYCTIYTVPLKQCTLQYILYLTNTVHFSIYCTFQILYLTVNNKSVESWSAQCILPCTIYCTVQYILKLTVYTVLYSICSTLQYVLYLTLGCFSEYCQLKCLQLITITCVSHSAYSHWQ